HRVSTLQVSFNFFVSQLSPFFVFLTFCISFASLLFFAEVQLRSTQLEHGLVSGKQSPECHFVFTIQSPMACPVVTDPCDSVTSLHFNLPCLILYLLDCSI